jgi:hypothetical protein
MGYEEVLLQIKRLTSETPVFRPISYTLEELIILFTDIFRVGTGAWVGQEPTPETTIPISFHSQKLATTHLHYPVHELKHLAIVDAGKTFQPIL